MRDGLNGEGRALTALTFVCYCFALAAGGAAAYALAALSLAAFGETGVSFDLTASGF